MKNRMGDNNKGKKVRDIKAGELGPASEGKVSIDIQRGNMDVVSVRLLAMIHNDLSEIKELLKK